MHPTTDRDGERGGERTTPARPIDPPAPRDHTTTPTRQPIPNQPDSTRPDPKHSGADTDRRQSDRRQADTGKADPNPSSTDQPNQPQPPPTAATPDGTAPRHELTPQHTDTDHTNAHTTDKTSTSRTQDSANPAATPTQHDHLFTPQEAESYRTRWHQVQGHFVDDPTEAVTEADKLLVDAMKTLAEHKRALESWRTGDTQTEDLRHTLRSYRAFLDRLLKV